MPSYGKAVMLFLDSTTGDFVQVVAVNSTVNQPGPQFRFEMLRTT